MYWARVFIREPCFNQWQESSWFKIPCLFPQRCLVSSTLLQSIRWPQKVTYQQHCHLHNFRLMGEKDFLKHKPNLFNYRVEAPHTCRIESISVSVACLFSSLYPTPGSVAMGTESMLGDPAQLSWCWRVETGLSITQKRIYEGPDMADHSRRPQLHDRRSRAQSPSPRCRCPVYATVIYLK